MKRQFIGAIIAYYSTFSKYQILLFVSSFISTFRLSFISYLCANDSTTVLFTLNASLHKTDWLLTTWLPALSCLFICARKQSDEHSWSKMFVFPFSRELHCSLWILFTLLVVAFDYFFSHTDVVGLLANKFVAFVFVAFVYRFNVKRWYTSISIFLTICWIRDVGGELYKAKR